MEAKLKNPKSPKGQQNMPINLMTEEIVISGISGKFPESDSIQELRDNLFNGVDMVTEDDRRCPPGIYGIPKRMGKMKDITKLDATFFGINGKQAMDMDPQPRMLLEAVYEAIVDAGVKPHDLRGRKVGVFAGASGGETEEALVQEPEKNTGYLLLGCAACLYANRISFVFDFKGPSCLIDTACSSSLTCLQQAVLSLRTGQSDAAIVTGSNICLNPIVTSNFQKLSALSVDGKCKSFDADASGFVRSEAVVAVFLQRASQAKRHYATIVHVKANNDGYTEEGITYPSKEAQVDLLTEVYQEAAIDPADVEYVEAHGTGTIAGDLQETNCIADFFRKEGKEPLLIGTLKSNIGHTESASGLAAVAKIVIAMEEGVIPANLHFSTPNPKIPGLVDGRLTVISKHMPYKGGLVGVSGFGFGGANVHAVLKPNPVGKDSVIPVIIDGPKLFNFSGRTEESVRKVLSFVEEHADDHNLYTLLAEPALSPLASHPYRGYTILNSDNPVKEIRHCSFNKPPIWYVYPGMGTQWSGMGRDLLKIEVFHDTVMRIHEILKPYGIDMYKLIMESDETTYDDILNSFVVIACMQIALTNILRHIGIEPDGIVGHSVGELGCAYADGCFSEEEMIMSAYWRGYHTQNSSLPPGAMAAVGLTWEDATQRCPEGVVPACHNAEDSVTISGSAQPVSEFVKQLKAEGKFAKEVNSSGYAFHCHYMADVAPGLKKSLEKTIPNPKPRTSRWASSSIPEPRWGTSLAQTSSAAYFVNNLVSPVLFHAAVGHIPKNALVIEIAPHNLLQAVLKRTLGPDCTFLGLMKRNQSDSVSYLLGTLGKLYVYGLNPSVIKLYPPAPLPVPRGTPMISPLIEWDHSQSWRVAKAEMYVKETSTVEVDVSSVDSKDHYLVGHTIEGRVLYPATGYLVLAWKALAQKRGKEYAKMPVVIEDVTLHRATILPDSGTVKFQVNLLTAEGQFEISEGGNAVVTGKIYEPEDPTLKLSTSMDLPASTPAKACLPLTTKEVYKELRLNGYEYGPTFQGILEADNRGTHGKLKWDGNWVSYLDTALQFTILRMPSRSLHLPTGLQYIRINPEEQERAAIAHEEGAAIPIMTTHNIIVAGGVEMMGLKASSTPHRPLQQSLPVLEEYHFVPFMEKKVLNSRDNIEQEVSHYTSLCTDYIIQKTRTLTSQGAKFLPNSALLADIAKRPSKLMNAEQAVNEYLSKSTLNVTLLKVLSSIFTTKVDETFQANIEEIFYQSLPDLQEDSLLAALLNSRILKTCLDLVQENTSSAKIKIVEAGAAKGNLFPKLAAIIGSKPLLQVDCTATDLDPEKLNDQDLQKYRVKTARWDFTTEVAPSGAEGAHLIFANGILTSNKNIISRCLCNLTSALKEGGFLLLLERTEDCVPAQFLEIIRGAQPQKVEREALLEAFKLEGLELVAEKADGILSSLFLLRKVTVRETHVSVITVEENSYEKWVEEIKKQLNKMQQRGSDEHLWLVAHDKATNGIIGLTNCLCKEVGVDKIRCIFNPSLAPPNAKMFEADPVNALKNIYGEQLKKDLVVNAYRDGAWGTYRHIPIKNEASIETYYAYNNILSRGDLSSFQWIESELKYNGFEDSTVCQVYYSAINFKDTMIATGKLNADSSQGCLDFEDCYLGLEFSGRDATGRRVMGSIQSKAMATCAKMIPTMTYAIPDHWTMEDAVTVPVVYCTVYYSFFVRGNLKKTDKVLIHAGSGGIGQAAIAVALGHGCEVFTTVSSQEKRDFLKKQFPQLQDRHFANSRDTSFEQHIIRETGGRGVDVVLNSLAGDKLMASVRLLAKHGTFLEIGKYDFSRNTPLGMDMFLKNTSFHGILLDTIFVGDFEEKRMMAELLTKGIQSGVVKPLCRKVFERDQVEQAYRLLASGKHIGKVVVKIRDEEPKHAAVSAPRKVKAMPRMSCHPEKSYVVTGGLGGFGLELCFWLVSRGARQLVLSSRTGIRDGYQSRCVRLWEEHGVRVIVSTNDVATEDGTTRLLTEAAKLGSIGGIFNLAMVLRDGFMENQTVENFIAVCTPKAHGTHHLDKVSRKLCKDLDYFVVFSSVSCGHGNAGQSNYGYANSVMERICELRQKDGLPGLAIQWGAIGDVGVILESMGGNDQVVGGTLPQRITSCMATLDKFLNQPHSVVLSYVLAERLGPRTSAGKKNLAAVVANILGISDIASLSPDLPLGDLGMDSLMGVEIKQALERDFNTILSINDIRQMTMKTLAAINSGDEDSSNSGAKRDSEKAKEAIVKVPRFDFENMIPAKCLVPLNAITKGAPLFIVHPIEGGTTVLESLASKIACPVYGIQSTAEAPMETMEGLAAFYIEQLRTVQPRGPYRISGYSFGAIAVFEMATQLQKKNPDNPGIVEKLLLLDGSPDIISSFSEGYRLRLKLKDMSHSEADSLCTFMLQLMPIEYAEVRAQLTIIPSWAGKLSHTADILLKSGKFKSREDIVAAADAFRKKLLAGFKYSVSRKFSGDLTLIRALQNTFALELQGKDYGLGQVCTGDVKVHVVDGDHDTFILGHYGDKCAEIINRIMSH